jgi:hypothetical protein
MSRHKRGHTRGEGGIMVMCEMQFLKKKLPLMHLRRGRGKRKRMLENVNLQQHLRQQWRASTLQGNISRGLISMTT